MNGQAAESRPPGLCNSGNPCPVQPLLVVMCSPRRRWEVSPQNKHTDCASCDSQDPAVLASLFPKPCCCHGNRPPAKSVLAEGIPINTFLYSRALSRPLYVAWMLVRLMPRPTDSGTGATRQRLGGAVGRSSACGALGPWLKPWVCCTNSETSGNLSSLSLLSYNMGRMVCSFTGLLQEWDGMPSDT
jgi:hypothetical protein